MSRRLAVSSSLKPLIAHQIYSCHRDDFGLSLANRWSLEHGSCFGGKIDLMKKLRLVILFATLVSLTAVAAARYWPSARHQALARIDALDGRYLEQNEADGTPQNIVVLAYRPVTTQDLVGLGALRPLHRLFLCGSPVGDTDLAPVGQLEELQYLDLRGTRVTDAGLAHLQGLAHLKILLLANTHVTDAGLAQVRGLRSLKIVTIFGSRVTDAGVTALRQSRPDMSVQWHVRDDD